MLYFLILIILSPIAIVCGIVSISIIIGILNMVKKFIFNKRKNK